MRLSAILNFGKRPYGFKYRGKNRVVREIKMKELRELRKDYERTEQNMLILRYPYLTVEQSKGHMKDFEEERKAAYWAGIRQPKDQKFSKHVTLAERLVHLKVKEAWD